MACVVLDETRDPKRTNEKDSSCDGEWNCQSD
jgi:hypothetical protein